MLALALHHVSIITTDLPRADAFYRDLFELEPMRRPPFKTAGIWLACGSLQLHIILYSGGTFRIGRGVDVDDVHFAFRTDDFDAFVERLIARGFREDAGKDDPMRIVLNRKGLAGFPQVYLCDPDRNIVEVNGAPAMPA